MTVCDSEAGVSQLSGVRTGACVPADFETLSVQCTVYSVLYSVHCTVQCTVYSVQCGCVSVSVCDSV